MRVIVKTSGVGTVMYPPGLLGKLTPNFLLLERELELLLPLISILLGAGGGTVQVHAQAKGTTI